MLHHFIQADIAEGLRRFRDEAERIAKLLQTPEVRRDLDGGKDD